MSDFSHGSIAPYRKKMYNPKNKNHVNGLVEKFAVKAPYKIAKTTTPFHESFPVLDGIFHMYRRKEKHGVLKYN